MNKAYVRIVGHLENFDYVPDTAFRRQTEAPRDWIQAAFYIGLTQFADVAEQPRYNDAVLAHGEAERWGFFNRLAAPENVLADATSLARDLADGPTFANAMTKRMLEMEWAMSVEQAIEAEAVAQALCMETEDFARAKSSVSKIGRAHV